jgi:DNA polymerase I-like protein with 3'-5' exonuclease and polymerase domains
MRLITLDFETYYSKEFSLSKMTTEAYIRDKEFQVIGFGYKIDDGESKWVSGDDDKIAMAIAALDLENSYLICHNMAFDGAILAWRYGAVPKYYLDTLSMARPITGQTVGGSLAALTKKFIPGAEKGTEVVAAMGKRREHFTPVELARYGEYCKNDVDLTYILYNILRQWNPPKELYIQDLMIRMFTDPVLTLDEGCLVNHLANVQSKKAQLMQRIDDSIGRDALMSNPKFAQVLEKLGVTPPMKISLRTQKETYAFGKTDQEFKALAEHPNPAVQAVVAARLGVKSTLEETRTESFLGIAERGSLPILLNYWGAHTGRASGGDKMNLQNLPRGGALRKSICAPAGHVMIAVDSAQIEARVVAWFAGQADLVNDFVNNVDIYSKFASVVYGRPVDRKRKEVDPATGKEFNPDKVEGFVGKTCILGLGYGMGPDKFKATLKIGQGGISVDMPLDESKQTVNLYRAQYHKIAEIWKSATKALERMAKGFETEFGVGISLRCTPEGIHLPNGTMIRYPNLRHDPVENQYVYDGRYGPVKIYGGKMVENVVQALARIVVFDQMAKIDQVLRKLDQPMARHKVALTVHDEVVAVVPESYGQICLDMMLKIMSTPPSWCSDLPVSCEGDIGLTYGDAK